MAFIAALPELAEGAEAAGEAGEAAGEGGGLTSKIGNLFKPKPTPAPEEENKQQNVGESRTQNFQEAAEQVRGALRPGSGGVD